MENKTFQTGQTAAYLAKLKEREDVQIEMVTDDVLLVMITIDVRDKRVDNGPWLFALAIGQAAARIEAETGNPMNNFLLIFTAAWYQYNARPPARRKKEASR